MIKKKLLLFVFFGVLCLLIGKGESKEVNAAICIHSYNAATCTSPKTCKKCGKTSGSSLGHNYAAATCTSAKKCTRCGVTSGSSLGHNYSAATCTSAKKCSRCGTTSGLALGHSYKYTYTNPACTTPGYKVATCSRCSYTSKSVDKQPLGHNYKAYNCTKDKCSRCSATRDGGSGHNSVDDKVQKSATCTENGIMSLKCSKCGTGMGSRTITKLGHNYRAYNCTKDKCSRCSATRDGGSGHNSVDDKVQKSATCTENGIMSLKCSKCGTGMGSRTITKLGHDNKTSYTNATCTDPGYKITTCNRCSYSSKSATDQPLGHNYKAYNCTKDKCSRCSATRDGGSGHNSVDDKVQKSATCTENGIMSLKCSKCGTGMGTRSIQKEKHDYQTKYTSATCTEPGYKITTCSRCSYSSKSLTDEALGHDYKAYNCTKDKCSRCSATRDGGSGHNSVDDKVQKSATCTENGIMSLKCSKCGTGMGTRSIQKVKHDYQTTYTNATCTEPGYKITTCSRCSYSSKSLTDKALGHDYKAYNCTKDKCSRCSATRDGGSGHNSVDDKVQKSATCTENGIMSLKCSKCGTGMGTRSIQKEKHDYQTKYTSANCTEPGYKITTCSKCSYSSKSLTDEPLGHDYKVYNCIQDKCSRCSSIIEGGSGNHIMGGEESVITEEANCVKEGGTWYTCSMCGKKMEKISTSPKTLHVFNEDTGCCIYCGYAGYPCKTFGVHVFDDNGICACEQSLEIKDHDHHWTICRNDISFPSYVDFSIYHAMYCEDCGSFWTQKHVTDNLYDPNSDYGKDLNTHLTHCQICDNAFPEYCYDYADPASMHFYCYYENKIKQGDPNTAIYTMVSYSCERCAKKQQLMFATKTELYASPICSVDETLKAVKKGTDLLSKSAKALEKKLLPKIAADTALDAAYESAKTVFGLLKGACEVVEGIHDAFEAKKEYEKSCAAWIDLCKKFEYYCDGEDIYSDDIYFYSDDGFKEKLKPIYEAVKNSIISLRNDERINYINP